MKKFGRVKPRYSQTQKDVIVQEILSGNLNVQESSRHYQIPPTTIFRWLDAYTNGKNSINLGSNQFSNMKKEDLTKEDYKAKIKLLEKALEHERYKSEAYKTMIEIAEKEFSIKIEKKSGTKQSKR